MTSPLLSLIVPCYQEAEHLQGSISRLSQTLKMLSISYEVIFVEDCSRDSTREMLTAVLAADPSIGKLVRHATNMGRGAAVKTGIRAATGKFLGFIDFDLEVSPTYILDAMYYLTHGYDAVIGTRTYDLDLWSIHRHILSRGYSYISRRILDIETVDSEAGFKFFTNAIGQEILQKCPNNAWFFDTEIVQFLEKSKSKFKALPVLFLRRGDKTTTVKIFRDSFEYLRQILRIRLKG